MPGRRGEWDSPAEGEKEPGKSRNRSGYPSHLSGCEEAGPQGKQMTSLYESGWGLATQARRNTQWLSARSYAVIPGAVH